MTMKRATHYLSTINLDRQIQTLLPKSKTKTAKYI